MNDDVVLLVALMLFPCILGAGVYGLWSLHRFWALYARLCKDWEDRAESYERSLERYLRVDLTTTNETTAQLIRRCIQCDKESLERCRAEANHWRALLPGRLRDWYLGRA